jgi:hypothetical protein
MKAQAASLNIAALLADLRQLAGLYAQGAAVAGVVLFVLAVAWGTVVAALIAKTT